MSHNDTEVTAFQLVDQKTNKLVWESDNVEEFAGSTVFNSIYYLDFTQVSDTGTFYIRVNEARSGPFRISTDVYRNTADFLLNYIRQQRCGYNPVLKDSCHVQDGFIVFHPDPEIDSSYINMFGGWHDASDYLRYGMTSANSVFQMLFAWEQNPEVFQDIYNENGEPGLNNIPDILDEAKWGLDWLVKMNPGKNLMFKQIADDRDHAGFRLPGIDSVDYGKGLMRPVYFCTGEPQGYGDNFNRTTGLASLAAKYSSAFALGSKVLRDYYPEFADLLKDKAIDAYTLGRNNPGYCQTNPRGAPYFYEEQNWVDDMELAAIQLNTQTGDQIFYEDAIKYGEMEPFTPWMGSDTARHYQWYPFLNLGHYYIAENEAFEDSEQFIEFFKNDLDKVSERAHDNSFGIGIPFIWCSNNLVAAILTQCSLYRNITGDSTYIRMEASLRDWLLGCNPWGTSMIVGLPENGDTPVDTHSSISYLVNLQPTGGLVDGPVYPSIYNNLKGIYLSEPDEYENVQPGFARYHDDFADYSTNEPTLDGTASLSYYFSSMEKEGMRQNDILAGRKR